MSGVHCCVHTPEKIVAVEEIVTVRLVADLGTNHRDGRTSDEQTDERPAIGSYCEVERAWQRIEQRTAARKFDTQRNGECPTVGAVERDDSPERCCND